MQRTHFSHTHTHTQCKLNCIPLLHILLPLCIIYRQHTQTKNHTHTYIIYIYVQCTWFPKPVVTTSHPKHAKSCILFGRVERCAETQAQHGTRVKRVDNSVVPQPEVNNNNNKNISWKKVIIATGFRATTKKGGGGRWGVVGWGGG